MPPVAWMAGSRETDSSKPIDEAALGAVSEFSGRNSRERRGSLEMDKPRRPSHRGRGEGNSEHRSMVDAVNTSGGVIAAARGQDM